VTFHDYVHHHVAAAIFVGVWIWLSTSLTIRLWFKYKSDGVAKKLFWSIILSIPFFGWLAYGAFYTPLKDGDVSTPINSDAFNGGH
jgi:hypothetical protein